MNAREFSGRELVRVADPLKFARPFLAPLKIGDRCQLLSGGPALLVVELGDLVTVAWRDDDGCVRESTLPTVCVQRLCLAST